MDNPLFVVLFTDNSIYYGKKSYTDSGWKEIPNKSIKKIFFSIPTGDFLVLSEYEQYYQYIEATKVISGINAGKTQIEYIHILGKRNHKVIEYKIHVLSGDTKVHLFEEDNEYIQALNPQGWK